MLPQSHGYIGAQHKVDLGDDLFFFTFFFRVLVVIDDFILGFFRLLLWLLVLDSVSHHVLVEENIDSEVSADENEQHRIACIQC